MYFQDQSLPYHLHQDCSDPHLKRINPWDFFFSSFNWWPKLQRIVNRISLSLWFSFDLTYLWDYGQFVSWIRDHYHGSFHLFEPWRLGNSNFFHRFPTSLYHFVPLKLHWIVKRLLKSGLRQKFIQYNVFSFHFQ